MPNTGTRLLEALKERGWTAAELARQLTVSQPTIHAWIHGQHGLRRANAARVANVLEVPLAWLLFGEDRIEERMAQGAEELALLRLYRAADDQARQDALRRLRVAPSPG